MNTTLHSAYDRRWRIVLIVLIGTWVGTFGNSSIPVALPTIIDDFGVKIDLGVWVISIYTLFVAVFMPIYGWVGDRYGFRRLYTASLFGLGVAMGLAAFAPTFEILIGMRAVQAIFNAVTLPAIMGVIALVFPQNERGVAMGLWATVNGAAHGLGPIISGFLVDGVGWQAIFVLNGFVALVGAALVWMNVPPDHQSKERSFDFVGAFTLAGAMLSLMFAVSRGRSEGWTSPIILGSFGLFIGLMALFIYQENRIQTPFVKLSLFKNLRYMTVIGVAGVQFFCLTGLPVLLSIFLQDVHGFSAERSGWLMAPLAVTLAVLSPAAGRFADRVGFARTAQIGMFLMLVMAVTMTIWTGVVSAAVVVVTLVVIGGGMSLIQSQMATGVTLVVPASELGIAMGIFHMIRFISATFSVTIFGIILAQADVEGGIATLDAIHIGFYLVVALSLAGVALALSIPQSQPSSVALEQA